MKISKWPFTLLMILFLMGCQYSGEVTTDDVIKVLDAYKGKTNKEDYLKTGTELLRKISEGNPISSITWQLLEGKPIDEISYRPKVGFIEDLLKESLAFDEESVGSGEIVIPPLPDKMPFEVLESSFNKRLNEMGKGLYGINELDGSIYAIGFAQTGIAPSSGRIGFQESRNIAFRKAELMAKIDILNTITGADLTNYSVWEDVSSSITAEFENNSVFEKSSLESFFQIMSSKYSGFLRGCQVVQSSEGQVNELDYQVAVVVKFSPENYQRATNLEGLLTGNEALKASIIEELQTTPGDQLLLMQGSRIYNTEEGSILVGFGQSEVLTNSSSGVRRAYQKAELKAKNALQLFLAEQIFGETKDQVEELVETQSSNKDSQNAGHRNSNLIQQFSTKTEAIAQRMNLNTRTAHRWRAEHPISRNQVVGTVVVLSSGYKISSYTKGSNGGGNIQLSPINSNQEL